MHTLINIFSFVILAQLDIPFKPVFPIDTTVTGESVNISWEILKEGYEYKPELLYQSSNTHRCFSERMSLPWITGNTRNIPLSLTENYCWRLKYRKIGEIEYTISDVYRFSFIYMTGEDIKENDSAEDNNVDENIILEKEPSPEESVSIIDTQKENIDNQENSSEEEFKTVKEKPETYIKKNSKSKKDDNVMGVQTKDEKKPDKINATDINKSLCKITYDKRTEKYSTKNCNPDFPKINTVSRYEIDEDYDYVLVKGEITKEFKAELTILDCGKFSILKPTTWFKCSETKIKKDILIHPIYSPYVHIQGKKSTISAFNTDNSSLFVKIFSEKLNNEKVSLSFDIYFYINIDNTWLDFKYAKSEDLTYINNSSNHENKYFNYMFKKITGVTQWHGYTEYTSPHTGIDFGAVKKEIFSPADGIIYATGWDNYNGECNSGGKYIKIKHKNGMYTVYMHLDSYTKENGSTWNTGDVIKKGQQIGISGNTGSYNCQSLGYHLHYELRNTSNQNSHIDPVPYTNIDWDLIPTINWMSYPGRLTGDNPHPNF